MIHHPYMHTSTPGTYEDQECNINKALRPKYASIVGKQSLSESMDKSGSRSSGGLPSYADLTRSPPGPTDIQLAIAKMAQKAHEAKSIPKINRPFLPSNSIRGNRGGRSKPFNSPHNRPSPKRPLDASAEASTAKRS